MWCPKCAHEKTVVSCTVKGVVNERYRKCPSCSHSFLTVEAMKLDSFWLEYAKHILATEASEDVKQKLRVILKEVGVDPQQGNLFDS